jgi:phospholipid/cholesterol/gamma-HCH transport system substrate-binding protein
MTGALIRPNLIVRVLFLAALLATVVAGYLALQGGSSFGLRLEMTNANGLRAGSEVLLGGVAVGTVGSIDLGQHNVVIADLKLNRAKIRIGEGARARLIAANLLGEEYVALTPGDPRHPLPSGTALPPSRITVPTDLDQIVGVFDASTRERLAILINEMGIAVAGRKSDVSAILRQLPPSAEAATQLLTTLVHDNQTLRHTIQTSNEFVASVNAQKANLGRIINAASGAATTAALRADQLSQTLIQAPAALAKLKAFIDQLQPTATQLIPAVDQLRSTAGPLNSLLEQAQPFARSAVPALDRAASFAPQLTRLGVQATPTLTQAVPTVTALSRLARKAGPLTYWGSSSIADLLGALNGWSHAIQFRDGLGHIFNGALSLSPSIVYNLSALGIPTPPPPAPHGSGRRAVTTPSTAAPTHPATPGSAPAGAGGPPPSVSNLSGLLRYLVGR